MKLFYVPGTCALAPHIDLYEMGGGFEAVLVDRKTKLLPDGTDYNRLSPNGYVPALQLDDGTVVTEGAAIAAVLADQPGGEKLGPKSGSGRARLLSGLVFVATELHKNFSPLFRKSPDPTPRETLTKRLAYVDGVLAKQPFFLGDQFSAADAYLYTVSSWAPRVEVTLPPNVQAFVDRMAQRPSVLAARKAQGLS